MKKHVYLMAIAACVIVLTSCDKDDKPDPATPAMTYSEWFNPATYTKDTLFGIWGFRYDKAVPEFTSQVLDSCVILTFGKLLGYNPAVWPATQVSQLPISVTYKQSGETVEDTWTAYASVGKLRIRFVNDQNIYNVIANQHVFRYIIIKGGIAAGRNVATMSYRDICKYYNIPE